MLDLTRADVIQRSSDVALVASGMMLAPTLAAARTLGEHGVRRRGERASPQAFGRGHDLPGSR
jgi:hypothetical protein